MCPGCEPEAARDGCDAHNTSKTVLVAEDLCVRWNMHGLKLSSALICLSMATASVGAPQDGAGGIWRNPQNSVHVEVRPCANRMCGTVIWANEKAIADARRGGTPNLIGQQVFRDFTKDRNGIWRGRVFVPDIAKTFSGTIVSIDAKTLRGSGCLVGRIACKSQDWTRVR